MQLSSPTMTPQNPSDLSKHTCKLFIKRLYFSSFMRIIYIILILLCILSIFLNFIVQPKELGNTYKDNIIISVEFSISILITSEVALKFYSQSPINFCTVLNSVDYLILLISIMLTVITLNETLGLFIGSFMIYSTHIFRSALILTRIFVTCNFIKEHPSLAALSIGLNEGQDDDFRMRFGLARLRYKYRPTMAVLFEENEEDDEELKKTESQKEYF